MIRLLLARGASVEAEAPPSRRRPLHAAAQSGHAACAAALLSAGADVAASDSQGQTPLVLAASGGHAACLQVLFTACCSRLQPAADGLAPQVCRSSTCPFMASSVGCESGRSVA